MTVSKLRHYFNEYVWPGLGLFGESYILFSIGTLRPIWEMLYPQCFSGETCSTTLLSYITYSVVIGVMVGMIIIGTIAGSIGRRNGSITTAALMSIGSLGMTIGSFYFRNNPQAMLKNLVSFLFVFGIGVGGEYPLSASSASERAMSEMKNRLLNEQGGGTNDKFQDNDDVGGTLIPAEENDAFDAVKEGRGRQVILVFSMQGMGIFVNTLTLTFLFFITGQWKNNNGAEYYKNDDVDEAYYEKEDFGGDYNLDALLGIWLTVYVIGALTLTYVFISRYRHLQESKVWAEDKQKRQHIKEKDQNQLYVPPLDEHTYIEYSPSDLKSSSSLLKFSETELFLKHYGHRLFGTSSSWLLWDVAFYGNKLFQSSFIYALAGEDASLFEVTAVALLNAFVALLGYYAASLLVDRPSIGRLRLQLYGFLITGTLFCLCGLLRDSLSTNWLIIMYFGSSFFGQCGPNCTTFLIPTEIFPTEMRTMCHGISAAAGKVGALLAAVMFNYLSESQMFLFSGYCSFLAFFITFMTIPESSFDLHELDKKWRMTIGGKLDEYYGAASELRHLSVWERWSLNKS